MLVKVAVVAKPFLVKFTVYEVLALNPFNTIVPVDELQLVGFVEVVEVISGVGFMVTVTLPAVDVQVPKVAVTL